MGGGRVSAPGSGPQRSGLMPQGLRFNNPNPKPLTPLVLCPKPCVCTQAAMSGAPRGMMTPEMARRQMEAMRGMRPEDLEQMAAMGDAGAAAPSVQDAQRAAEMMKVPGLEALRPKITKK